MGLHEMLLIKKKDESITETVFDRLNKNSVLFLMYQRASGDLKRRGRARPWPA